MRDEFAPETKDVLAKRVGIRCSNPNCRKLTSGPQIKEDKVINIGVAAHITAAAPGGKRYNPNLTPEQRKHISNGIWLCQTCSKLIDSDEVRYPVPLLNRWKQLSEQAALYEVENKSIEEIYKILQENTVVISVNQSGGQTAHTIINQKPIRRKITPEVQKEIENELKKYNPIPYSIHHSSGDEETEVIAKQIDEMLSNVGWTQKEFVIVMWKSYKPGIEIAIGCNTSNTEQAFINLLHNKAKLTVVGNRYTDISEMKILIGPNPMNFTE